MASYEMHHIRALESLLMEKGIITQEEYRERVCRIRYEEQQSMKEEKYRVPYEVYKRKLASSRREE